MAKIVDIATEIYLNELDSDTETSIAAVAQNLRSQII